MEKGSFVFLSNKYFLDFPDDKLMKNKESIDGKLHDRPCYFAFTMPNQPDICWLVPFSSRTDKYKEIYAKKVEKYHRCDTLVFGNVLGHEKAFLIQNMCPTTEKYITSIYVDAKTDKQVHIENPLADEIERKAKSVLERQRKGIPLIFPDVLKIEKSLIQQLEAAKSVSITAYESSTPKPEKERTPFNDLLVQLTKSEHTKQNGVSKIVKDNDPDR